MKKTLLNTTLYLVAFVAIQVLITLVIGAIAPIFGQKSDSGLMLVISSATAGLLTLILFFCAKFTPKGTEYVRSRPWATLAWCSLAALGATIPSLALQELMPALPDTMSDTLMKIVHVPGGYFVLAIMAPLSEEAVFRGAIPDGLTLRMVVCKDQQHPPWSCLSYRKQHHRLPYGSEVPRPRHEALGYLCGQHYINDTCDIVLVMYLHSRNMEHIQRQGSLSLMTCDPYK